MELIVLGSGSAEPSARRQPASYLLRQEGFTALLDAGPGTLGRLAALGLQPHEIDAVLLTHLHPDHALDIVHLLFHRGYDPSRRHGAPQLVGPPGFRADLEAWFEAIHPKTLTDNDDLIWHEIGRGSLALGPWTVHAVPLEHRTSAPSGSIGLQLRSDHGVLSYTGDTGMCAGLNQLLRDPGGCLLCECTTPDDAPLRYHLTPSQVRRLADRIPPELLVLTHISPEMDRHPLPGPAFDGYTGRVAVAHDGMRISFDSGWIRTHSL